MAELTLPNGLVVQHLSTLETIGLYREIFERRTYADHGLVLSPGSVVVDAGANIGLFTLFVLQDCPDATVHCFEPAPALLKLLHANTSDHASVRINAVGLGASRKEDMLTYFPRASLFSGYDAEAAKQRVIASLGEQWSRNASGRSSVEVFCKTEMIRTWIEPLSDYIDSCGIERIDLLKIDVEGREGAVVEGVRAEHWPRIAQIAMEVHSDENLQALVPRLAALGYRVETVSQEPGIHMLYAIRAR